MANNKVRYGFRPFLGSAGGVSYPKSVRRTVATAYQAVDDNAVSVDLNKGDPVYQLADGSVALALTTVSPWGIVESVEPYWDGTKQTPGTKLPGGTAWGTVEQRRSWVHVIPVKACKWEIDVDDNTTATTFAAYLALVGFNVDHTCVNALGTATAEPLLDISEASADQDHEWRIVDVSQSAENADYTGTRVKLIVEINDGEYAGAPTTATIKDGI